MTRTTVALETLGCKVNQYESSYLTELLKSSGYGIVPFREYANIYIVHSCAVTAKAAFQTRQLLRRAGRTNPDAVIVAAGCDAQLEPERFAEERLATHVLGTDEKADLIGWLQSPGSFTSPCLAAENSRALTRFRAMPVSAMFSGRARAYLKVQDGCDAFCSYCIVPYTRGRSRSLPPVEVRAQMDRLLASGYREVVLTGIHLGQWGRGLEPEQDLSDLLRFLRQGPLPARLRFSSLEPMEWTPGFIEQITSIPNVCPHFHIPLQSGDPDILSSMQRPYTPQQYEELIHTVRTLFPDAALGADILAGYPGETEGMFRNTLELVERLPLTYFHVFPFSPRPGTPAADRPGRVTGAELKRRTRLLRELSARKRRAYQERFIGRCVEVLAEVEEKPGLWKGTSGNYLQVLFTSPHPLLPGTLVPVTPTRLTPEGLIGRVEPAGR